MGKILTYAAVLAQVSYLHEQPSKRLRILLAEPIGDGENLDLASILGAWGHNARSVESLSSFAGALMVAGYDRHPFDLGIIDQSLVTGQVRNITAAKGKMPLYVCNGQGVPWKKLGFDGAIDDSCELELLLDRIASPPN